MMKKVARLRVQHQQDDVPQPSNNASSTTQFVDQAPVRTTGRIKKPKAVFDPSDNYLPRSQRLSVGSSGTTGSQTSVASERKRESISLVGSSSQDSLRGNKRISPFVTRSHSVPHITANSAHLRENGGDNCYVCQKRCLQNKKILSCIACGCKTHKQCLDVVFDNLGDLIQNFKCHSCRICSVCESGKKVLLTCCKCFKSYHHQCHNPNVSQSQDHKKWKCTKCISSLAAIMDSSKMTEELIREIIGGDPKANSSSNDMKSDSSTKESIHSVEKAHNNVSSSAKRQANGIDGVNGKPSHEPLMHYKKRKSHNYYMEPPQNALNALDKTCTEIDEKKLNNLQEPQSVSSEDFHKIDVKSWNIEQVAKYFYQFFPNEAHVFREHEIDGATLLLLKRSDVVKKLPLKLGPALRIYSLVLKLQTKMNDATLGWNCDN